MTDSIAARYFIRLKGQNGIQSAIFTDWLTLEAERVVDDVGYYALSMQDPGDEVVELFELDGQLEIFRTVPGVDLDWYLEFEGLHRTYRRTTNSSGVKIFTSRGVGYNDLLARTSIMYKAGTIRAEKNAAAETAMKEYVAENCTSDGDDTAVGRLNYDFDNLEFLYLSSLPGFTVEADGGNGPIWVGSRPYEPLLKVLRDIANFSGIDFNVVGNGAAKFLFKTFVGQLGDDRTIVGLSAVSGKNAANNDPVTFSVPMGVVQSLEYELDRLSESTVVAVLGKGEGSTRTTLTRFNSDTISDSPWNRREITRPATNYDSDYETYSLQVSGDEILQQTRPKETFDFQPLQQPSQLYGLHYFLGDRVTAKYGSIERHKRITNVKISVGGNQQQEKIDITLSDIPI